MSSSGSTPHNPRLTPGNCPCDWCFLSLAPFANPAEINAARHRLALKHHPDRCRGSPDAVKRAGEMMGKINAACDRLAAGVYPSELNPESRKPEPRRPEPRRPETMPYQPAKPAHQPRKPDAKPHMHRPTKPTQHLRPQDVFQTIETLLRPINRQPLNINLALPMRHQPRPQTQPLVFVVVPPQLKSQSQRRQHQPQPESWQDLFTVQAPLPSRHSRRDTQTRHQSQRGFIPGPAPSPLQDLFTSFQSPLPHQHQFQQVRSSHHKQSSHRQGQEVQGPAVTGRRRRV